MYGLNGEQLKAQYQLCTEEFNGRVSWYYIVDQFGDIVPDADAATPEMAWEILGMILTEDQWADLQID